SSNLLAQAEALANGFQSDDPQKSYPGNRPSTMLLLDALTPRSLGALIAMYEHSVYAQSVLWGINAFDQGGVELGKRIAGDLLPAVKGGRVDVADPATAALLAEILARRSYVGATARAARVSWVGAVRRELTIPSGPGADAAPRRQGSGFSRGRTSVPGARAVPPCIACRDTPAGGARLF